MKISEYIAHLAAIQLEHGDLECQTYSEYRGRMEARGPCIDFAKILRGRESKPAFFDDYEKDEKRRGGKVCRI